MLSRPDLLVLGGGAAGAALALLAARRGLAVVLVERGRPRLSGPHETLLAAGLSRLHRIGLGDALLRAAIADPLRHGALWGGDAMVWRDEAAPGLLLARGRFDAELRLAAAAAGAVVASPAAAWPVADGWRLEGAADRQTLTPRLVVDARGREANRLQAAVRTGRGLLAVTLVGAAHADDVGIAAVEATADGWIWTHAPAAAPAAAAVMVDKDEAATVGLRPLVERVLAAAVGPAARIADATTVYANDATPRVAPAVPGVLRIGDAAAAIDPLASQGVEKALFAAEHALAVCATALQKPALSERLFAVHARWECGLWEAHEAAAAAWYGREPRFAESPFWRARRPAAAAPAPADSEPLVVAPHVEAAEILVRTGDTFDVRPGYRDRRNGDELAHVGYVPVDALLQRFGAPTPLPVAVATAGADARLYVLPPRAVDAAMRELRRRGWLIPAASAAASR